MATTKHRASVLKDKKQTLTATATKQNEKPTQQKAKAAVHQVRQQQRNAKLAANRAGSAEQSMEVDQPLAPVKDNRPNPLINPHAVATVQRLNDASFQMQLDVGDYYADEIDVSVHDEAVPAYVVIEGKHAERRVGYGGLVSRAFQRRHSLPDDVDAKLLQANLSARGEWSEKNLEK